MSIIKEIIPFVVSPFNYICNLSFYSGDFLYAMKIAKVLPVHKNGAKNEFNNYRPISLLPQFSKILEKLFDLRMENLSINITFYMIVNLVLELADPQV